MAKQRNGNGRRLVSQQSVDQAVKSICDIMRRGNCAGAMQYVPELTWILFLRILDEKEQREERENHALGVPFRPSLEAPFRWRDWAAPPETLADGQANKRVELQNSPQNAFFNFVNTELLPHLILQRYEGCSGSPGRPIEGRSDGLGNRGRAVCRWPLQRERRPYAGNEEVVLP